MSSELEDLPLPPHWESRFDVDCQKWYFIDHASKTTSWNDPRSSYYASTRSPVSQTNSRRSTLHSLTERRSGGRRTPSDSSNSIESTPHGRDTATRVSGTALATSTDIDSQGKKVANLDSDLLGSLRSPQSKKPDRDNSEKYLNRSSTLGDRSGISRPTARKSSTGGERSGKAASTRDNKTALLSDRSKEPRNRSLSVTSPDHKASLPTYSSTKVHVGQADQPTIRSGNTSLPIPSAYSGPSAHSTYTGHTNLNQKSNNSNERVTRVKPRGPDPSIRVSRTQPNGPNRSLPRGHDRALARGPQHLAVGSMLVT